MAGDNTAAYFTPTAPPFIANITAYTDICHTPSLRQQHDFFSQPEIMSLTVDLNPIFSSSKLSIFQDLLYPQAFSHAGRAPYTNESGGEFPWNDKDGQLYWRGSTTGGHGGVNGGWKRQHRQRLVRMANNVNKETATILSRIQNLINGPDSCQPWTPQTVPLGPLTPAHFNVSFTQTTQCDTDACTCADQRSPASSISFSQPTLRSDAWRFHWLVADIDDNAFSGRFYAMLHSGSAVAKQTLFREWHDDFVRS